MVVEMREIGKMWMKDRQNRTIKKILTDKSLILFNLWNNRYFSSKWSHKFSYLHARKEGNEKLLLRLKTIKTVLQREPLYFTMILCDYECVFQFSTIPCAKTIFPFCCALFVYYNVNNGKVNIQFEYWWNLYRLLV